MKRPKQLPAVDRNANRKIAVVPAGAYVNPSDVLGTLGSIAGAVLPLLF